jgi:hypothetical protein
MWLPILLLIVFLALLWAGVDQARQSLAQLPHSNTDWIYY